MPEMSRFTSLASLLARAVSRGAVVIVVAGVVAGTVLPAGASAKHVQTVVHFDDGQGDSPLVP